MCDFSFETLDPVIETLRVEQNKFAKIHGYHREVAGMLVYKPAKAEVEIRKGNPLLGRFPKNFETPGLG